MKPTYIFLFSICLFSCVQSGNSNQNKKQDQVKVTKIHNYESKQDKIDIDENSGLIDRVLNSCTKKYSFKHAKLSKSDDSFSPPKTGFVYYSSIILKITSKNIKMYDSNFRLIKSFILTKKSFTKNQDFVGGEILIEFEHSTDNDDKISLKLYSEDLSDIEKYQLSPTIDYVEIKYQDKGLNYFWDLSNVYMVPFGYKY